MKLDVWEICLEDLFSKCHDDECFANNNVGNLEKPKNCGQFWGIWRKFGNYGNPAIVNKLERIVFINGLMRVGIKARNAII